MAEHTAPGIARKHMVESQVRPNHVRDPRVIAAMRALPREDFAPPGAIAYADADLPLGEGRFLLAPMLAAQLAQLVLERNPSRVLVVAAGSGYVAAVLAAAGAEVTALEADTRLDTGALATHAPKVTRVSGPLHAGWPASAPYDAILIEGAVPAIPELFQGQLAPEGRLITILAGANSAGLGRMVVAQPSGGAFSLVRTQDCSARLLPAFSPAPAFTF